MKLLSVIFAVATAEDKKVPPRHPLQRLARLNEFSEEILNQWFDFLPSKQSWINKFAMNAARMERNFNRGNQRCGHYDSSQRPHGGPARRRRSDDFDSDDFDSDDFDFERLSQNPTRAVRQITTGYRKWAERYLSQCSGQRAYQYQINRMNLWNNKLQAHFLDQYPIGR